MLYQPHRLRFASCGLLLLLTLTACGKMNSVATLPSPPPQETAQTEPMDTEQKDSSLTELRNALVDQNVMGGILFLGYFPEQPLGESFYTSLEQQGYLRLYPFLSEIPPERIAKTEGDEVYCIIPADPKASISVNQWVLDETGEHKGDLLYRSNSGEPFLISGNLSDIMPNISVSMMDRTGNSFSDYNPSISLKDGSVVLPGTENTPLLIELPGP